MSKLKFSVSVDDDDIPDRIRRSIKGGMRDAGDRLLDAGEKTAKNTIQKRGRVWRRELMNSFDRQNEGIGKGRRAVLWNFATHAGAVEEGAVYGARGPPVEALIPWVISKWNPGSADTGDGDGGPSGSSSKDSTTRSKRFSNKQRLQNVPGRLNYEQISDEVWSDVDIEIDRDLLTVQSAGELRDALSQHPELDAAQVDEVSKSIARWKLSSKPGNERVEKYAAATKEIFGIEGTSRGPYVGDIEAEYADAFRAWSELSKIHLHEQVGDEDGRMDVIRGLTRETGPVAAEMFDNPSADRWTFDASAINNYTTEMEVAKIFDRGLIAERNVSIDDDITMAPDWVFPHPGDRGEMELHLIGGDGASFSPDNVFLTYHEMGPDGKVKQLRPYTDFQDEFEQGDFSGFTDPEIHSFTKLVKQISKYDQQVTSPAGQQRVINLRDEYVSRFLYEEKGLTRDEARQMFNNIIA